MARRSLYVAVILVLARSCSKTVERIEIVPGPLNSSMPGSARASTYEAALTLVEERRLWCGFERFRDTQDRRAAFAGAFGLEPAAFELAFVRRWRETVSHATAQR